MNASDTGATPRGRISVLLLAVLFVGVAAALWHWSGTEELLPLRVLRIQGSVVHTGEVELREAIAPYVESGFAGLDLAATRKALEGLPWIASAEVRRSWPDTLEVAVREQAAVGRWETGGLLNEEGELFFPPEESVPEGLPLLHGPEGSEQTVLQTYRTLERLVEPLGAGISRIAVDERRSWQLTLGDGMDVIIGRDEIEQRVSRFVRAYRRVLAQRAGEIGRVDLRYTNGFAVRWKTPRENVG